MDRWGLSREMDGIMWRGENSWLVLDGIFWLLIIYEGISPYPAFKDLCIIYYIYFPIDAGRCTAKRKSLPTYLPSNEEISLLPSYSTAPINKNIPSISFSPATAIPKPPGRPFRNPRFQLSSSKYLPDLPYPTLLHQLDRKICSKKRLNHPSWHDGRGSDWI